jgi:hypothetical protein
VQRLLGMATDDDRRAHLDGIARHNSPELADRLRRTAWSRMLHHQVRAAN